MKNLSSRHCERSEAMREMREWRGYRHCERSEAIQRTKIDCFVASLLAMTGVGTKVDCFVASLPAMPGVREWRGYRHCERAVAFPFVNHDNPSPYFTQKLRDSFFNPQAWPTSPGFHINGAAALKPGKPATLSPP